MSNQRIDIESVVKCIVKTNYNISVEDMKDLKFTIKPPNMNYNNFQLSLTNQYRISMSLDKKENKIYLYDIGIVRTYFRLL